MDSKTEMSIAAMLATGVPQARIAREMGVSRYQVRKVKDQRFRSQDRVTPVSLDGLVGRVSRNTSGGRLSAASGALFARAEEMILEGEQDTGINDQLMDDKLLRKMPVARLLERVVTTSPEISRAVWDWLRLYNPGYDVKVYKPGTETEDPVGQAMVDGFIDGLRWRHGDENVVWNRQSMALLIRGGVIGELVLNDTGTDAIDIATPDPAEFRYRFNDDGTIRVSQIQDNQEVVMDRPTFRYIPLDPMPKSPVGRSPLAPALFPCLFLLGVYQDLRRVVANQGYPRLDISINLEKVKELIEFELAHLPSGEEPYNPKARIAELMDKTRLTFSDLRPGDSYVHLDLMELKNPVGTLGQQLQSIDAITTGLERMAVRALKTMPLMLGITDGVSEANANRQWEIHAAGVKAIQHLCENLNETMLELMLQARGVIAKVEFRFAELRAAERKRDAESEQLELANALFKMVHGFLTPSQAAMEAVGFVSEAMKAMYPNDTYTGAASASTEPPDDPQAPSSDEPNDGGGQEGEDLEGENKIAGNRVGEVIPPVPENERLGDADAMLASERFDAASPTLAGILDAEVA